MLSYDKNECAVLFWKLTVKNRKQKDDFKYSRLLSLKCTYKTVNKIVNSLKIYDSTNINDKA